MKTGLLLRQEVPKDKERITFNFMHEVDDMWIQFFYMLHKKLNLEHSEIWMWNGSPRTTRYFDNFVERWYKEYPTKNIDFDLIFSRGGFKEYIPVMQACSGAFKLYYGAIFKKRLSPEAVGDTTDYNLILADSKQQYNVLKKSGYNVHKFLKPACENIFHPRSVDKEYDVVFIANAKQKKLKGHEWFLKTMSGSGLKILQIGNLDKEIIELSDRLDLNITFTGWIPRNHVASLACRAKVGVCCSTGDSCPRIIPEMLAMNIPVVVREHSGLSIWGKYFLDKNMSCRYVTGEYFLEIVMSQVKYYKETKPRKFYLDNFSLERSSTELVNHIRNLAG